jgi:hypothetical protein
LLGKGVTFEIFDGMEMETAPAMAVPEAFSKMKNIQSRKLNDDAPMRDEDVDQLNELDRLLSEGDLLERRKWIFNFIKSDFIWYYPASDVHEVTAPLFKLVELE